MKIEMTESEMLRTFGNLCDPCAFKLPLKINDETYLNVNLNRIFGEYFNDVKITLEMVRAAKIKSPQELAAEEAVQKAESALKAAKEVLDKVKEK